MVTGSSEGEIGLLPFATRGKVLLKVTMVSLPMGRLVARSSTSALARLREARDAFSLLTLLRAPDPKPTPSSSLLSDTLGVFLYRESWLRWLSTLRPSFCWDEASLCKEGASSSEALKFPTAYTAR